MRTHFAATVAAIPIFMSGVIGSSLHATTIDFEDIFTTCCANPPSGYQGLTWGGAGGSNSWVISPVSYNWGFPGTLTHSGTNYAWSNGGGDISLSGPTFSFDSLWVRTNGFFDPTDTVTVKGFNGATEIYTQDLLLTTQFQLFALNFTGITSWTLTNQNTNVLIDDITINSPVPIPAALPLFAGGLGLLAWMSRRRHRTGKVEA